MITPSEGIDISSIMDPVARVSMWIYPSFV
jgi:hypothetical protein